MNARPSTEPKASVNWAQAQKLLDQERDVTLRTLDTSEAISRFTLAWQIAMANPTPRPLTGLVEQQRLFARLKRCKT